MTCLADIETPMAKKATEAKPPRYSPAPWTWHTSNSWKRLMRQDERHIDRPVIEPVVCRDGHPDLNVTPEDMALIRSAPVLLYELESLIRHYVNLMESARDRIVAHGGECDPVAVMEANDPVLRRARSVIAEAKRVAT